MTPTPMVEELALPTPAAADPVMALLARGVPLTLLMDLLDPTGPRSEEILRTEGTQVA